MTVSAAASAAGTALAAASASASGVVAASAAGATLPAATTVPWAFKIFAALSFKLEKPSKNKAGCRLMTDGILEVLVEPLSCNKSSNISSR